MYMKNWRKVWRWADRCVTQEIYIPNRSRMLGVSSLTGSGAAAAKGLLELAVLRNFSIAAACGTEAYSADPERMRADRLKFRSQEDHSAYPEVL